MHKADDEEGMAMPEALGDGLPPQLDVVQPEAQPLPSGWGLVGLFSGTLFLSALLLFSIQPIFAKMLLPLLGGAPAVWNTAMLFYQAALLAGYAYAHFAPRWLSPRVHLISHIVLLLLPLAVLPFHVPSGSEPQGGSNPIPWLLVTMALAIGAPFFVVSTTGPLLQRWFSRTGHPAGKDPYFLYAASNLGSMLALLGYPFVVEPNLRLAEQSRYWQIGYGVLVLAVGICALQLRKSNWVVTGKETTEGAVDAERGHTDLSYEQRGEDLTWPRRLRWIALAMVPSSLMIGVTQYISTDVAAVPLLWVVPLALYLLTFTNVFARRPIIPHWASLGLMPVSLGLLVVLFALNVIRPMHLVVGAHLLAFFFAAMVCHGEMAKDRPPVRYLTEFYLWMSVGGVLGGFFNAIVAPLVFPLVLEYPLALAAAAALYPGKWRTGSPRAWIFDFVAPALVVFLVCLAIAVERRFGMTSSAQARSMIIIAGVLAMLLFVNRPLRFALGVATMMAFGLYMFFEKRDVVYVERSFFGVTRIESNYKGAYFDLFHGTTLHGLQAVDPEIRNLPISYYHPTGPIGVVLGHMRRPDRGSYAVVGLGAGSLAAYGREGETWTFYEIDPVVEKVATNSKYFHYLSDSKADVRVVLGDARVSLRSSKDAYDLLVLDAYSSDAVPLHLLTKEALDLYGARMKLGGIIAFHISNKHLELGPVVHELCRAAGLESRRFGDYSIRQEHRLQRKTPSDWIIAYRPGTDVEAILANGNWKPTEPMAGVGLWTDDFSSIWSVYGK